MRVQRTTVVIALAVLAATGCAREPAPDLTGWEEWERPPEGEMPPPFNDGTLIVERAAQAGDMGDIRAFEAQAIASNATYAGTSASVRLDSLGDDWWVMAYVSVGNLDILAAAPGTYRTTSAAYSETDPYLSVTGCSGPSYGNYTFDGGAQETEITITENDDGSRTLEFHAIFSRYDTGESFASAGTFVYRRGTIAQPEPVMPTTLVVTDTFQEGAMGDIASYAAPATTTSADYYGPSAYIRLDSVGEGWWVMSGLSIGNLDLRSAPAGVYRTISGAYEEGDPALSVTGCSGPSYGNYTFDGGAQDVELTLSDNADGSRSVDLVTVFGSGETAQVSRAHFTVRIAEPTITL